MHGALGCPQRVALQIFLVKVNGQVFDNDGLRILTVAP